MNREKIVLRLFNYFKDEKDLSKRVKYLEFASEFYDLERLEIKDFNLNHKDRRSLFEKFTINYYEREKDNLYELNINLYEFADKISNYMIKIIPIS
jgi:hypothetical protein